MSPALPDIRALHDPVAAAAHPTWWPLALGVALGVIALAALTAILVRGSRRRHATPEARALRALAGTRPLIERGDAAEFSLRISTAVREYVERAFGVRAPRRTTEELLTDLMADTSPVAAHRRELGGFLELCDLAKYARGALSRDQRIGLLTGAETFVRATAGGAT